MQEYVEKAYNIFLFLCTNSIKKRFKSKKLKKIMKYIIISCNCTDFFYTIAKLCDIL